ncbi:MAG: hypothetical protein L7S43_03120 [Flavobacteriaceae bacterium]|nr:hypothetical protein [Flavobacteriaceae bacterium]
MKKNADFSFKSHLSFLIASELKLKQKQYQWQRELRPKNYFLTLNRDRASCQVLLQHKLQALFERLMMKIQANG